MGEGNTYYKALVFLAAPARTRGLSKQGHPDQSFGNPKFRSVTAKRNLTFCLRSHNAQGLSRRFNNCTCFLGKQERTYSAP